MLKEFLKVLKEFCLTSKLITIFYYLKQPKQKYFVFIIINTVKRAMSLHEILEGCMQNNIRDHKHLYEKYYGYSLKIIFRYIYRYDKATDVVNDGFVKVFSKLNQFHYESSSQNLERIFMGWLKTIMIHTAIDRLRKDNFCLKLE